MSRHARINWLAWWQLLRAANVFTAASNVIAGFLLVQRGWEPIGPLLLLVKSSALLYLGGMVLNDVCDAELDAIERPERPIPSGRVGRQSARNVGIALLLSGVVSAHIVSWLTGQWQTAQISIALAATIVAYNAGVKSTWFGPLAMGSCRMMNVILGASIGTHLWSLTEQPGAWAYAGSICVYTMGITILARGETEYSTGNEHITGIVLILSALAAVLFLPLFVVNSDVDQRIWMVVSLGMFEQIVRFAYGITTEYAPSVVQTAVSRLLQNFIVADAAVSALAAGWFSGLIVLSLLVPTRLLARKLPMT